MIRTALLLSGGMDSYALAFQERPDLTVTIDYGQRPAAAEIAAAKVLTEHLGIDNIVISINLSALGSGDLSNTPAITLAPESDWWPFRNQALITLAAMKVISYDIRRLLIATVKSDSYHADGSATFIAAMNHLLKIQEGELSLEAPASNLSTTELVKQSGIPYSLLAWSHSCHTSNIACGQCRGCIKHRNIVEELGYAH